MEIFITGGSGFVGRALCHELTQQGHKLHCFVRPGAEERLIESPLIKPVAGDIFAPEQLVPLIKGADAVIHLIGIIREFPSKQITFERLHLKATQSIVSATQQAGVKRYLHMSANGTNDVAKSAYHKTKWQAELVVRKSSLDWTIFRPSLIYGAEDQFINMLTKLIRKLPLVPVMGDGEYQIQPVSVDLLSKGFAAALEKEITVGKTYYCGGAECLSYNQLLDLLGQTLGKKTVHKIHQPLALMRPIVSLFQYLSFFPLTSDQLQMLLEGNCCEIDEWRNDLGLVLSPLSAGLEYLKVQTKKPRH